MSQKAWKDEQNSGFTGFTVDRFLAGRKCPFTGG
jgi:hypothetical protein